MASFETEITIVVRVEYSASKGTAPSYIKSHGNWLPGDPPEVTNVKALFPVNPKALYDMITKQLNRGEDLEAMPIELNLYNDLDNETKEEIIEACFLEEVSL